MPSTQPTSGEAVLVERRNESYGRIDETDIDISCSVQIINANFIRSVLVEISGVDPELSPDNTIDDTGFMLGDLVSDTAILPLQWNESANSEGIVIIGLSERLAVDDPEAATWISSFSGSMEVWKWDRYDYDTPQAGAAYSSFRFPSVACSRP